MPKRTLLPRLRLRLANVLGGRLGPWGRWTGGFGDRFVLKDLGGLAPKYYCPEAARELAPVNAAVHLLANELAALPVHVEEQVEQDGMEVWEPVWSRDREAQIVMHRWEAMRTRQELMRMAAQSVLLHGFAAIYVVRDDRYQLSELVLLDPDCVTRSAIGGKVTYRYGGPLLDGIPSVLDPANLAWIEQDPPLDRSCPPRSAFEDAWPTIRADRKSVV